MLCGEVVGMLVEASASARCWSMEPVPVYSSLSMLPIMAGGVGEGRFRRQWVSAALMHMEQGVALAGYCRW
ncbi:hypothetical protein MJ561_05010 [Klebsiella pneumoniae]|nr:hypothetical protein MJ561_05010 [Klebsiella pneumoniae]